MTGKAGSATANWRVGDGGTAIVFCMFAGAKRITQLPLSAVASLGTLNLALIVIRFWSTSSVSSGTPIRAMPG